MKDEVQDALRGICASVTKAMEKPCMEFDVVFERDPVENPLSATFLERAPGPETRIIITLRDTKWVAPWFKEEDES